MRRAGRGADPRAEVELAVPFIGGLFVSGALMLAGLFGFQATSNAGDATDRPGAGWKERGALCHGPASTRDEALCELLRDTAS